MGSASVYRQSGCRAAGLPVVTAPRHGPLDPCYRAPEFRRVPWVGRPVGLRS